MSINMPTYQDLFNGLLNALTSYKKYFPNTTLTDDQIAGLLNISFMKIEGVFGQFRTYSVKEETPRNEFIKRAVCFEANSMEDYNTSGDGGLNSGDGGSSGNIKSESMGNISTTYNSGIVAYGVMGGNGAKIASVLGLMSLDAGVILSRYIRKSFGWNSASEYIPVVPISCDLSIWGLDGFQFNLDGLWLPDCTAFKGA